MSDRLVRLYKPLDLDHLQAVLEGAAWSVEPLASSVPLDPLREAVASLDASRRGTEIDRALVEPCHRALSALSRRDAADMRIWHYLTVKECPDLVWRRWKGEAPQPEDVGAALGTAMSRRFLGRNSLNGISRNTLARLWWTGEQLHDGDNYDLARTALSNQDMFQAIFERFFGIYPAAAKACLARFPDRREEEHRKAARWLQQCLSTTVLEALSEDEVGAILDEVLVSA